MSRSVVAVIIALVSVVCAMPGRVSAQTVPITLEASGVITDAQPGGPYAGVANGTAYTIEYDLDLDITAPFLDDAANTAWSGTGTVTLDIDGLPPIVSNTTIIVQYLYDPFAGDYDMVRFLASLQDGSFRVVALRSEVGQTPLDPNAPPSAEIINDLPIARQSNNSVAFTEQDNQPVIQISGNVTSFLATGGAAPMEPEITSQPSGDIVDAGDSINLQVIASGTELAYQWYRNGVLLTDGAGVSGSQNRRLQITPTQNAKYLCVVSNPGGSATSNEVVVAVNNTCPADQNFDGMLSPTDFSAWIGNYNAGCP